MKTTTKKKVGEGKHDEMTLTGSNGDSSCQSCVLKMLHREPGSMCQDVVVDDDYDNDGDDIDVVQRNISSSKISSF